MKEITDRRSPLIRIYPVYEFRILMTLLKSQFKQNMLGSRISGFASSDDGFDVRPPETQSNSFLRRFMTVTLPLMAWIGRKADFDSALRIRISQESDAADNIARGLVYHNP